MINDEFIYLIQISDDCNERYYLKSIIDEGNSTISIYLSNFKQSWFGTLTKEHVQILARKFPSESKDSFYSHTQRAFSNGNAADSDGRNYAFTCKKREKNRIEFIWKEKIEAIKSLKLIGNIELQEKPNEEILPKIMDYAISTMDLLKRANGEKQNDIQRISHQLQKALETVKRTTDLKDQLEADLYRKFVLVLNEKKTELRRLKDQIESYERDRSIKDGAAGVDNFESYSQDLSPEHPTTLNNTQISSPNKRNWDESSDTDTNDQDNFIEHPSTTKKPKTQIENSRQDSLLDLGNDQMDYRTSTFTKHHQRRITVTKTSMISTTPFASNKNVSPMIQTPSLPDDSQTTDDLLNKI